MTLSSQALRVLMITSEWPTREHPWRAPFIVRQVRFLREAGVDVDVFTFRGNKNPWNYARAWLRVQKRLKNNYDIIHAQFGQSGLLALPKRLPLVVTFHGSDLEGIVGQGGQYTVIGQVLRLLSKWVALQADAVIVVSRSLARHLPKKCAYHVIPGGVDLDLFRPMPKVEARKALGLPQEKWLILFGGNPDTPVKRYSLAKQAVEILNGQYYAHAEIIVLQGILPELVPLYMNACDVLLLTSLHEGSPTVVKEALACNLPVVSVDVGDVRERIGGLQGCVVCSDDRPETIARALEQVLTRDVPFHGREAVQDLDERIVTRRIIEVYHEAISLFTRHKLLKSLRTPV